MANSKFISSETYDPAPCRFCIGDTLRQKNTNFVKKYNGYTEGVVMKIKHYLYDIYEIEIQCTKYIRLCANKQEGDDVQRYRNFPSMIGRVFTWHCNAKDTFKIN